MLSTIRPHKNEAKRPPICTVHWSSRARRRMSWTERGVGWVQVIRPGYFVSVDRNSSSGLGSFTHHGSVSRHGVELVQGIWRLLEGLG